MPRHVIALLLAVLACEPDPGISPFEQLRPVCHQTSELGNFGCAMVGGQVVGARGQPLQEVSVIAVGSGSDTRSGYELTDQDGQFMLRVIRYAPPPTGDSSSSWVRAVAYGMGPPEPIDSVLVRFRVRPVGALPDTLRVVITLDVP